MQPFATGAHESAFDSRTYRHALKTLAAPLPQKGGYVYPPQNISDQHTVGICTAISTTQNAKKALGKDFSPDFQYLLQKKYIDGNWEEGSSIFSALKVGKKYGFLRSDLFTGKDGKRYISEVDRIKPYDEYIAKLQDIPEDEVARLLTLCTDKLVGYAQVPIDSTSLAQAILDSKAGILTRYVIGSEWWTAADGHVSYQPKDIDPLRAPKNPISGHAINQTAYDFSVAPLFEQANTWGTDWNNQGRSHTNYTNYRCTEAWIPYYETVPTPAPTPFIFTVDMNFGDQNNDVKELQKRLISLGYNIPYGATGKYGLQTSSAVLQFQIDRKVPLTLWERWVLRGMRCGAKTRTVLNSA